MNDQTQIKWGNPLDLQTLLAPLRKQMDDFEEGILVSFSIPEEFMHLTQPDKQEGNK